VRAADPRPRERSHHSGLLGDSFGAIRLFQ